MSRRKDVVRLIGAALLVCIALLAAFWITDEHQVSYRWVFRVLVAIIFCATAGWEYRDKLRSGAFLLLFVIWLVIWMITYGVAEQRGFFIWIIGAAIELFLFYMTAWWLFGALPLSQRRK